MKMDFIASTKLSEFLTPRREGEPVNVHVVPTVREPQPDFDAMQRVIKGTVTNPEGRVADREHPHRKISEND
jgi:hypothetical protein